MPSKICKNLQFLQDVRIKKFYLAYNLFRWHFLSWKMEKFRVATFGKIWLKFVAFSILTEKKIFFCRPICYSKKRWQSHDRLIVLIRSFLQSLGMMSSQNRGFELTYNNVGFQKQKLLHDRTLVSVLVSKNHNHFLQEVQKLFLESKIQQKVFYNTLII